MSNTDRTFKCSKCGTEHDRLEEFPGRQCLDCYAKGDGERMARTMTADRLARMWGGR